MKGTAQRIFAAAAFALFIGAWLSGSGSRAASSELYQTRLTAADGADSDEFGVSVAVSGDTAIVGAFNDGIGANQAQGSAYIFVKNGESWTQQQKLTASDGGLRDVFGISVAVNGDTAIIGARSADVGTNTDQGAAYVFTRSGTTWTQQQKLTAADGAASDYFGVSVAMTGDTLIVGASGDSVGANTFQGSAYIFTKSGATWTQQQKLTASDGAAVDYFGNSVAISGDTVIVGAFYANVGGVNDEGAAYVFTRSGAAWTQQQKLTAVDFAQDGDSDFFGNSVAVSGDTAVIGAYYNDVGGVINQGSAYVFTRSGTAWTQQQKLTAPNSANGTLFGNSVAVSGETVVVGAYYDDSSQFGDQGAVYKFVRSGGTTWNRQEKISAADSTAVANFGSSVALSGDRLIVGAYNENSGAVPDTGAAYIFDLSNRRPQFDFDGDGRADLSVFRPSNGTWYLNQSTSGFAATAFGISGDLIAPADFDGDGKTDLAVFRPGNNIWYLQRSGLGFTAVQFGASGDVPMPADFDGDGRAELAVFRPSNGTWYRYNLTTNQSASIAFGANGDVPAAGDYDADGKADLAVFRPSTGVWYLSQSTAGFAQIQFGTTGDKPVSADYDGDGKTDLAVFRPSDGTWYLQQSTAGFAATAFGIQNDLPSPADFDGDGRSDIAVFRPSSGTWYLLNSFTGFAQIQFGASGDLPAANAYVR